MSIKDRLPQQFLEEMQELLKDDFQAFLAEYDKPSFNALRINTLKISVEDFLKINPFHLEKVPWSDNGFYYSEDDAPSQHPYYHAGLYYLQEPSAMSPAQFLPIEEGDVVLDGCSAPGGKATELAYKLKGTGLLVSNDISASRQKATLHNIEKSGIANSYIISEDLRDLNNKFPAAFDKILLDAPCSGEGMFRKDPSLINSWKERGPQYYAPIQKDIIEQSYGMLKDGGMLLYSTCTFAVKEDEEVIQYFLDNHPDMEVVPIFHPLFSPGLIPGTCRLYPHKLNGEGHFLALLKKQGSSVKINMPPVSDKISSEEFQQFMKLVRINNHNYKLINDNIYLLPDINLSTSNIRTLRSGLLLGELSRGNFEPAQSLAMALKEEDFQNTVSFNCDDERVIRYLKGETLEIREDINGWVLVCVDHFPLGFGKAQKHRLKNKIDKGWRKL